MQNQSNPNPRFRAHFQQAFDSDSKVFRKQGLDLTRHCDAAKIAIQRPSHFSPTFAGKH